MEAHVPLLTHPVLFSVFSLPKTEKYFSALAGDKVGFESEDDDMFMSKILGLVRGNDVEVK